ncbi:YybH family protein [Hyphococcus sp.]|uniref:YybH family protein n=1 Tax=Hyphococcus sp. TaxID=2038636 RepID=UPI003CCB92D5
MTVRRDETQIRELHEAWIAAEMNGDEERLAAMIADDFLLAPPDTAPIIGRDAFMEMIRREDAPVTLQAVITKLHIDKSDALKLAEFSGTSKDGTAFGGAHVWRLRKQGVWRVTLATWIVSAEDEAYTQN